MSVTPGDIERTIDQDFDVLRGVAREILRNQGVVAYDDYALALHRVGDPFMHRIWAISKAPTPTPEN